MPVDSIDIKLLTIVSHHDRIKLEALFEKAEICSMLRQRVVCSYDGFPSIRP